MKRIVLSFVFILCMFSLSKAQDYNTGVGLRGGFASGLTVKHFLTQKSAFEGILDSRWRGFDVTLLYEIHNQAFDVDRLRWYFGGGGHLGFWNGKYTPWGDEGTNYIVIGVDGILGIEYSFSVIPINIGLDWKPAFNLVGYSGFWPDGGAISIRFIF
jgi:hypothetical protein